MVRARRDEVRVGVLAGLLAGVLLIGPAQAAAADQGAPVASQANPNAKKVSPYSRYAREHAKAAERSPNRVKPSTFSVGHAPRPGGRASP